MKDGKDGKGETEKIRPLRTPSREEQRCWVGGFFFPPKREIQNQTLGRLGRVGKWVLLKVAYGCSSPKTNVLKGAKSIYGDPFFVSGQNPKTAGETMQSISPINFVKVSPK